MRAFRRPRPNLRASPSEKLEILDAMQAPTIRKGAFGGVRDRLMALFDGL